MTKITMDVKYTTRDGRPVRIYAVDAGGVFPVHGAIHNVENWISHAWTDGGKFTQRDQKHAHDLIPAPPKGGE